MTSERAALFFTARRSQKLLIYEPAHKETIHAEGAWGSLTFTTKTFAFAGIQRTKQNKAKHTKQKTYNTMDSGRSRPKAILPQSIVNEGF